MFTAMLSVENILGADHDVWSVNVEAEYHEQTSGDEHEERDRPRRSRAPAARARRRGRRPGRGVEGGCRRPVSRRWPGPAPRRVRTRRTFVH